MVNKSLKETTHFPRSLPIIDPLMRPNIFGPPLIPGIHLLGPFFVMVGIEIMTLIAAPIKSMDRQSITILVLDRGGVVCWSIVSLPYSIRHGLPSSVLPPPLLA